MSTLAAAPPSARPLGLRFRVRPAAASRSRSQARRPATATRSSSAPEICFRSARHGERSDRRRAQGGEPYLPSSEAIVERTSAAWLARSRRPYFAGGPSLAPQTIDEDRRTIEVCWTTGARVRRRGLFDGEWDEELSVRDGAVQLQRLNSGAPVLNSHAAGSLTHVIGVVEQAWMTGEGRSREGRATLRFSERAEVEPIWQDVKSGILRNISVGYRTHKITKIERKDDVPLMRADLWEPYELSLCTGRGQPWHRSATVMSTSQRPLPLCRCLGDQVARSRGQAIQPVAPAPAPADHADVVRARPDRAPAARRQDPRRCRARRERMSATACPDARCARPGLERVSEIAQAREARAGRSPRSPAGSIKTHPALVAARMPARCSTGPTQARHQLHPRRAPTAGCPWSSTPDALEAQASIVAAGPPIGARLQGAWPRIYDHVRFAWAVARDRQRLLEVV